MEKESFTYTYSAEEQEEIKKIREKYEVKETNQMDKLRQLDAGVTNKATTYSLVIGIVGILVMGSGMSLVMSNLGEVIGLWNGLAMAAGIGIGLIGMMVAGLAYPVYSRIIKKERAKIAPEILKLTDELML